MGPYRTTGTPKTEPRLCAPLGTRDLVLPFAMLWVLSLVRVVSVAAHDQVFGSVDTLAMLALFVLPWLLFQRRPR